MIFKVANLVVALTVALQGCYGASIAEPQNGKNFTGSSQHSKILYRDFDSNYYFVSEMATNWASADRDCKAFMGNEASLLRIETPDEWAFISLLLEDYGTAVNYWTDGQYNGGATPFRFSWGNSVNFGQWTPWGVNQPPTVGFAYQRVSIYHTSRFENDWRVRTNTELNRYICEYPRETMP